MNENVSKIEVQIFGTDYKISSETEPEYIQRVAKYVDFKMRELARAIPNASSQSIAVLAAINIADELFQFTDLESNEEYETRTKKMISMLDQGLSGDY